MAIIPQGSFIFDAKTSTPQELARKRAMIAQIMGSRSAPKTIGEGLNALGDGIVANVMGRRADQAEAAGLESASEAFNPLMEAFQRRIGGGLDEGGFPAAPNPGDSASMATMPATDTASARVAQAHGSGGGFNGDLRGGIIATAEAIGADPLDLATAISYETAGTFDPTKKGPRTQWGQHRGLIQFGEPQAKQHGVNWDDPIGSQLGPDGAIASYFKASGFQPGMSGLDLYSTINAGAPGRYNRSDANNGGAPGTVQDKWEKQMTGHREKAMRLIGDYAPAPAQAPQTESTLTPEALQQWAFQNYAPDAQNSAVDAVNTLGNAQPVGVAEDEAGILAQEQAMMGQDRLAFQQQDMMTPPQGTQPRLQAPMAAEQQPMPQPMLQAAPPLPDPRMVDDMPVAGIQPQQQPMQPQQQPQQFAQAGGFPEMAGNSPQAIPAPGIDMQAIAKVLTNPFSNPEQRAFAQMMLEQEMQKQDPMRQLDMDYKRAQTQKIERELSGELGDPARVQTSVVLDDGSTVMIMNNGQRRVLSPTGEEVTGQAAADAIRSAREYTVDNQREIYTGRREGTLGADIELGGAAAGAKKGGEKTMEAGFSAWEDYGKLQSSLGNINEAISAIDNGAKSGLVYNMLPNVTEASASLQNAMNRMGLDVIGSVTFGALSEGEMRLAMETAVPRGLQPAELRNWLIRKRDAQEKAAGMLADAAQFLTVPGNTINDWIAKNRASSGSGGAPAPRQPVSIGGYTIEQVD